MIFRIKWDKPYGLALLAHLRIQGRTLIIWMNKIQQVNLKTHQHTTYPPHSQPAASSMSSSSHTVSDGSDIEPQYEAETNTSAEIHTDIETDPDREYYIENQQGLPDYQFGIYESSPPPPPPVPVDANVNDELNNEGEFFF